MKHKVSELTGALLDAAVAKAEGEVYQTQFTAEVGRVAVVVRYEGYCAVYSPSTNWGVAGPILEREGIELAPTGYPGSFVWSADLPGHRGVNGPTPLIAAMRAYVASKFGEEVEL